VVSYGWIEWGWFGVMLECGRVWVDGDNFWFGLVVVLPGSRVDLLIWNVGIKKICVGFHLGRVQWKWLGWGE